MIYLNEWLPNPVGNDKAGEFIELFNNGNAPASLNGWVLATDKKKFSLSGYDIPANGYVVLKSSATKLTLKNMDGVLSLYGPGGGIVDRASFVGTAQEGRSWGRVSYGDYDKSAAPQAFAWGKPTPGAKNQTIKNAIAVRNYPTGVPFNSQLGATQFLGIMLGAAIVLMGLLIYVIKKNENISNIFFGGNEKGGG